MFGIDLGLAFFAGLIWWEIVLLLIVVVGMGISLNMESAAGFFVGFAILFFVPWTAAGSLWASVSLLGIIWYLGLFILTGIGWSFWKWRLFVQEQIDYGKKHNDSRESVKSAISERKNYDTIIYWILLWPFSAAGYLINDFIYNLVKGIVDRIYTVYDRITDKMLGSAGLPEERKSYS